MSAVAIAWTLDQPGVTGAIVGLRRSQQVEALAGTASYQLSEADLDEIDSFLDSA